jgi:uncharacterized protein (TIGR03435 family)
MNPRRVVGAAAGALCLAATLSAAQEVLEFEFVSVRRSAPPAVAPQPGSSGSRAGFLVLPDGRVEVRSESLANLARVAFGFDHVDPNRGVVQAANWMWNDRFDITAAAGQPWTTPPPGTSVPAELRTMLRALLEDRFALQARIATARVDVSALRLARKERLGPGLRPSVAVCEGPVAEVEQSSPARCAYTNNGEGIRAEGVTMMQVVQLMAANPLFRWRVPSVDQTGLAGRYDVSFTVPRRLLTVGWDILEFEAQLGLTVRATNIRVPTLIIERARKPRED